MACAPDDISIVCSLFVRSLFGTEEGTTSDDSQGYRTANERTANDNALRTHKKNGLRAPLTFSNPIARPPEMLYLCSVERRESAPAVARCAQSEQVWERSREVQELERTGAKT